MRAAAYCRVSTDLQEEGHSLEHQDKTLRAEIEHRGWEIGVIREEIVSTGKPMRKRRQLMRLLDDLDAGEYGALLVTRLDRVCRSSREWQELLTRAHDGKWALVCLSPAVDLTDPYGRAMAAMAAAWAELERELISQRTKDGLAVAKAKRLARLGAPPFDDRDTFQLIADLRQRGKSSREIAAILNMEGVATKRGGPWYHSTVNKTMARFERRRAQDAERDRMREAAA